MRAATFVVVWVALLSGCCLQVEKEGDFSIEMPKSHTLAQPKVERELVTLDIRLETDDHGELSGIFLDRRRLVVDAESPDAFALLHRRVRQIVEQENVENETPRDFEAVIHADPNLNYAVVISTISAVSGNIDANDNIRKLVQRITFAPATETPDQ